MKCPKCRQLMERLAHQQIEIERCTHCKGIWFDMLEQEDLKVIEGSEAIDVGDRALGRKHNQIGDIKCPICSTRMLRMVDLRQPHIWYESCPVCYGVFFDAGEFQDYKEETILDLLKSLIAGRRD